MGWYLESDRSSCELSARHWFWGRNTVRLGVSAGRLVCVGIAPLEAWIHFDPVTTPHGTHAVSLRVHRFAPDEAPRYIAQGELRVDDAEYRIMLRIHDLGHGPALSHSPPQRFLTLSGCIVRPTGLLRRWWPAGPLGDGMQLYAHTEWRESANADTPQDGLVVASG